MNESQLCSIRMVFQHNRYKRTSRWNRMSRIETISKHDALLRDDFANFARNLDSTWIADAHLASAFSFDLRSCSPPIRESIGIREVAKNGRTFCMDYEIG